jgi:SWI/SNF-related matrix-associated actin-dependent regulator 1 of chromatin subfamily A
VPAIPVVVPGMVRPYRTHQAAAHLAANADIAAWGAALLGDDMGLGKTQVLAALISERIGGGKYAIVVIPPVALAGYQQDFAAAFPHLRVVHLKGRKVYKRPDADVYLINDDSQTMAAWLTYTTVEHKGGRDVKVQHGNDFVKGAALIGRDEIHRDKGNQGKPTGRARTMLAVGAAARERRIPIVGMTGTLLTNRPVEAFIPLQILGGEALVTAVTPGARKASGFLFRYCAPQTSRFGTSFGGVDLDEARKLHDYLRRTIYVRREKADLGDDLPHSGWIIKPIALNGVLARYERIERDFLNLVAEEEGPEAMWRKGRAEAITRMQAMWEEAGVAKAPAAIEYVQDLVDQGRKVVVFYYHQRTWDKLANGFARAGTDFTTINGSVTGEARTMAVEDFQNGTATVLLAQIKAAGMAVTLTAAADAVFVQVPWSAGDLKQAADRILRTDDRTYARAAAGETITWHVLQAAHDDGTSTFDMAMWSILEGKAKVCDAVNAGRPVTMSDESIMQQALEAWYPQARSRY